MHVILIDNDQFSVGKGRRLIIDGNPPFQELPQQVARRPVDDVGVVFLREDNRYPQAAQGRRLQDGKQASRRDKVGCHDHDGFPGR